MVPVISFLAIAVAVMLAVLLFVVIREAIIEEFPDI